MNKQWNNFNWFGLSNYPPETLTENELHFNQLHIVPLRGNTAFKGSMFPKHIMMMKVIKEVIIYWPIVVIVRAMVMPTE